MHTDKEVTRNGEAMFYFAVAIVGFYLIGSSIINLEFGTQLLLGVMLFGYATFSAYKRIIALRVLHLQTG